MKSQVKIRTFVIVAAIAMFAALPAAAQATRTWVSGVGDDANPCSRTAPCKTFAGAISKTATGGEINVLDPGGFGAVTITKSISIISEKFEAGVLVSGTNGIIINAPTTSIVILRGLDIEGLGTGLNGINFLNGGSLTVEDCTINNFAQKGINFAPTTAGTNHLFVSNTVIRNNANAANGGAIFIKPGVGVSAVGTITNVRMEKNKFAIRVEDRTKLTVKDSISASNAAFGFLAFSTGPDARMTLSNCSIFGNSIGIRAEGSGSKVLITGCSITGNDTGLSLFNLGVISSWGNNYVSGNTVDGAPNEFPLQQ